MEIVDIVAGVMYSRCVLWLIIDMTHCLTLDGGFEKVGESLFLR